MNARIKLLRKESGLTQEKFAERIGLKQNSIALIESGKRNISDQTVLSICREFNVREEWLRTGQGEMYAPAPSSALEALAIEKNLTDGERILIDKFVNLKPEIRHEILQYIQDVAAAMDGGVSSGCDSRSVADAEAAYEKTLDSAQNTEDVSALNITEDMACTV